MPVLGITDHLEGPRDQPSADVVAEVLAQTELADALGFEYAWFAEHHAHAHAGHVPAPLLLALHAARADEADPARAGRHLPEPAPPAGGGRAVRDGGPADGRAVGVRVRQRQHAGRVGPVRGRADRRARAAPPGRRHVPAVAGRLVRAGVGRRRRAARRPRPRPAAGRERPGGPDLVGRQQRRGRPGGRGGRANVLFSHLRTPEQYRQYAAAYRAAGGRGLIAANRPVHVAATDAEAFARAGPALRTLWRRFRAEGKIPADAPEPERVEDLCGHPINFVVGGPASIARQLAELHEACTYDVANFEVRWAGLAPAEIHDCMRRLATEVKAELGW